MNTVSTHHKGCGGILSSAVETGPPLVTYIMCFSCGTEWRRAGNAPIQTRAIDPCDEGYELAEEGAA